MVERWHSPSVAILCVVEEVVRARIVGLVFQNDAGSLGGHSLTGYSVLRSDLGHVDVGAVSETICWWLDSQFLENDDPADGRRGVSIAVGDDQVLDTVCSGALSIRQSEFRAA